MPAGASMRRRAGPPPTLEDDDLVVPPHPLGVAPLGQLLLLDGDQRNLRDGMGKLSSLSDEILMLLLDCCSADSLARCGCASRGLRVFCLSEDLWRARLLEALPEGAPLHFSGSWRHSYVLHATARGRADADAVAAAAHASPLGGRIFSDALFTPWFSGTASIPRRWSRFSNIERVDASTLSVAEFASRFEAPGVPVILTGLASRWSAVEGGEWSADALRRRFGSTPFNVGGLQMELANFLEYAAACRDETPLYLFDKHFGAKAPALAREYEVPAYFGAERDLFAQLPAECRPDHRWLIVGGTRSGSGWHVDPNASSAWNAVVCGAKKWVLTPPGRPPPGVTASDDGSHVTAPISLYEWFRVFYSSLEAAELRHAPPQHRPREAVVRAGEILFVPRGWWHTALNLQPTVAITQNYVPFTSAAHVLRYLNPATAHDLVSGVKPAQRAQLHAHFVEVIRRCCPEALDEQVAEPASDAAAAPERGWWDELASGGPAEAAAGAEDAEPEAGGGGGFSFGFSS